MHPKQTQCLLACHHILKTKLIIFVTVSAQCKIMHLYLDIREIIDSKSENENREYMYFTCVWFLICKRINFFFTLLKI